MLLKVVQVFQRLVEEMDMFYNPIEHIEVHACVQFERRKKTHEHMFVARSKKDNAYTDQWMLDKMMVGIENRMRLFEKHGVDQDEATSVQLKSIQHCHLPMHCRKELKNAIGVDKPWSVITHTP